MTPKEALNEITTTFVNDKGQKWYTYAKPPYGQSHGASTALRIMCEKCTIDTMKDFFGRFGYTVKIEVEKNK